MKDVSPEELVAKAENDMNLRRGYERAELFFQAAEILQKKGDCERGKKLFWDGLLFNLELLNYAVRKETKERFAPKVVYTNGVVFPDIRKFTKEQIEYYKQRAENIENSVIKVRYYDIIWELEKDHIYARKAIDAYLECINIYLESNLDEKVVDSLTRAAELSITLNDLERFEIVKKRILKIMEKWVSVKKYRYVLDLIDIFIDFQEYCEEDDLLSITEYAQAAIRYYRCNVKNGFVFERDFLRKLVELEKRLKKHEESAKYREEIAESYEREAEWKFKNYPQGASVSAVIIKRALQSYANIGNSKKVEELKKLLKERTKIAIQNEMKKVGIGFEMPKLDDVIKKYLLCELSEVLDNIASDNSLIPDINIIRQNLIKQKEISPLPFIIPRVSIRNENPVESSITKDDIFENHVRENVFIFSMINGVFLSDAIDILIEKKDLNSDNLSEFLSKYDVYDGDKLDLIKKGLSEYFKGDYVSAIHILIPQIEATTRRILEKIGKPTTIFKNGVLQEKTLDGILRDEDFKKYVGEDIWYYLKIILVDKVGYNLRNDVAHGLMKYKNCSKDVATLLIHILLLLTRF